MKRVLALVGIAAALILSAGNLLAQGNNGGGRGGGRGNFDPAQFQQRMMENVKERLGFTNDTEWSAVQPLVQKVMDARRDVGFGGTRFGRRGGNGGGDNGGDQNGGQRRFGGEPSAEAQALQSAVDSNAPSAQIKAALEKYRTAQKDKQAKLEQAQSNLRKVLSTKQEAEAVLLGLLN